MIGLSFILMGKQWGFMEASDLLTPRFIIGLVALLSVVGLMITETVSTAVGVTLFVGIVAAFGAYQSRVGRRRS